MHCDRAGGAQRKRSNLTSNERESIVKILYVAILTFLAPSLCSSQTLTKAAAVRLQPLVLRDAMGFKSCGVRVIALRQAIDSSKVYDFSVNIFADSFSGMIKAGAYSQSEFTKKSGAIKAISPNPATFWVATADQSVPLTAPKFVAANDAGFIMGSTEIVLALSAILSISKGENMQFAVKYKSERIEDVITFAEKLPADELDSLQACIAGVHRRMTEINEKLSPGK